MALFRSSKPNVKALARRGDEDGLVAAAGFQDLIPGPHGGTIDRGAQIRQDAILALGALGPDAGADAIEAALSDPSDAVRVAAIHMIYAREDGLSLAAALAWLPRERNRSRPLAMRALAELRRADWAPALASALVHASDDVGIDDDEATLLNLLLEADEGSNATSEVVEALLVALAEDSDVVAERAEELLALIAPASTEGVIAELTAGAAPARAARVLGSIKDTRALGPLIEALLHRDPAVRAHSAAALGELRDPVAVEPLIRATRDPDHRVRAEAGAALDRLGMVALVVGVSTLVRPMIHEAVAGAESRPALPETDGEATQGQNGPAKDTAASVARDGTAKDPEGKDKATSDPSDPEVLEQLLAEVDDMEVGPF
jgi:HEAT repeat protein